MPSNAHVSTSITSDIVNCISILLYTVKAKVHRVDRPDNKVVVTLILDTCSQKSYISARLRDHLQVPTLKAEKIIIKEFGNVAGTTTTCDSVQIAIKGEDTLIIYMNAFVVKNICSPISKQAIDIAKSSYCHLREVAMADRGDGNENMAIDILVGADYLWTFMLDNVVQGEQGPIATLMCFGSSVVKNERFSNITIAHVLKTEISVITCNEDLPNAIHNVCPQDSVSISNNDTQEISEKNPLGGNIHFIDKSYEVALHFVENDSVP